MNQLKKLFFKIILVQILCFFVQSKIHSQCTNPPNGPDCLCTTATLLCTPDLLDGFTFSMSTTPNLGGYGPFENLCPGQGSVANNVNWFSFIAWCNTLTMNINISNCTSGTNGSHGVQLALFSACPHNGSLACLVNGGAVCGTAANYPNSQTISVNGLIIGNPYYFMLDGCGGSACDVNIDVVGVCGTGTIDPWTTGITGPLTTCVGNTDTYITEDLNGAVQFYYYLDGTPIANGTELKTITRTWTTAGTFELCVDVANLPCIPESDPPPPYCITIMVCDAADAGTINLVGNPFCPGDVANFNVTGYTNDPDHDQYLIITNPAGLIIEVIVGATGSFTYPDCGNFLIHSYNVKIGNPVPTIGTNFPSGYPCPASDNCCDNTSIPISFEDQIAPTFPSPPANLTLVCIDNLAAIGPLTWNDNCMGTGQVTGTETGNPNMCTGGPITRTWSITDSCGNVATHNQTITISPITAPTIISPPANVTVACSGIPTSAPTLNYSNGMSGVCDISGVLVPTITGSADLCGGVITNNWNTTDMCGNVLNHNQTVTVNPVPLAVFANPPASVTIDCNAIPSSFPNLTYDNGEAGACRISGSQPVVTTNNYDICGGLITNVWEFIDACGRPISQTQVITINPSPAAVFTTALPQSITVNCDAIPAASGQLSYSNGETGICEISGVIDPVVTDNSNPCGGTIIYQWNFTDACGRNLTHTQTITINPAPVPVYLNPPSDITVNCSTIPSSSLSLNYENGLAGICQLSGSTVGVLSVFDPCTLIMTETWNDTDACGNPLSHSRNISISPLSPVVFLNPPANITVSCDAIPASFPSLNYTNNESGPCSISGTSAPQQTGSYNSCGGVITLTWQAMDFCAVPVSTTQIITVTPATPPAYVPAPADITVSCEQVPVPSLLQYSNGLTGQCALSGSNLPTQTGSFNVCGGNITYNWSFTDPCGNTITEQQNITVTPAPMAVFNTLPQDITVNCDAANNLLAFINFNNNLANPCLISGSAPSINTGTYDECGGVITQNWTNTDPCGRTINHSRTVTVNPAPPPVFINPPANITLACGELYTAPGPLDYTNSAVGNCLVNGQAPAMVSVNGIVHTHTWSFLNACNNLTVSHTQTVTESPSPNILINPAFINICLGDEFDLSAIMVSDQNNTIIDLTYFSSVPANPGSLLSSSLVSPTVSTIYSIVATNQYGCTDEGVVSVIVDQPSFAGEDGFTNVCDNTSINLYQFLGPNYTIGGSWLDSDNSGLNLDNPSDVNFSGIPEGTYSFVYTVISTNSCPNDEATVFVEFNPTPEIVIDTVFCTNSNTTYSVILQSNGFTIVPNFGDVLDIGSGIVEINNIPINNQLIINFFDPINFCSGFTSISPPDCDCPSVPAPTATNLTVCQTQLPGILMATAVAGTIINWYSSATDMIALSVNSPTYISPETLPGTYTYYVESESIEFPGCVSSIRVPVVFRIVENPIVTMPVVDFCLDANESILITLSSYNNLVNTNVNNQFTYFANIADAMANQNSITSLNLSSTTEVYVTVKNINDCISLSSIIFIVNENPMVSKIITDEICFGNKNGTISYSIIPSGINYEIFLNNTYYYTSTISNLEPKNYFSVITDTSTNCSVNDTFEIKPGQIINEVLLNAVCDNNGTDTDSTDDFYVLNFNFSQTNGIGTQYEIFVNNVSQGIFNFNQLNNINIAPSTIKVDIKIVDISSSCEFNKSIGPYNPCSTNCVLTVDSFTQVCNNNGTNSDPSDDYVEFVLQVSAINGSIVGTFQVLIDDVLFDIYNYNEVITFTLAANNVTPTILLIDSEDSQCTIFLNVAPLNSCSTECYLEIIDFEATCFDGGTENQLDDDIFTIEINVDILNGIGNFVQVQIGNDTPINFDKNNISFDYPADGSSFWVYVSYPDSLNCIDSIFVGPLDPCSSSCKIKLQYYEIDCFDNSTPFDQTDDYYELSWMLQAVEGNVDSNYIFSLNNVFNSVLKYSDTVSYILPANSLVNNLKFVDSISAFCLRNLNTIALIPCSDSCLLSPIITSISCNNNGTNNSDLDDVFFADINVSGLNTTNCWMISGQMQTYDYNELVNLGPYLIADGDVMLTLIDCENFLCPIDIVIESPSSCSECIQQVDAGIDDYIDCTKLEAELIGISSEIGVYNWSGPTGFSVNDSLALAKKEGWYYFTATYSDGCIAVDSVFIDALVEIPQSNAGKDSLLTCAVQSIELIGTYESTSTDISFVWKDAAGAIVSNTIDLTVVTSGTYSFQIIDNTTGCNSALDNVFIGLDIEQPMAIIYSDPGNVLNCAVDFITFTHETEPNVFYLWTDPKGETSTSATYIINSAGVVILTATDTINGCVAIDSITIDQLEQYPIIDISAIGNFDCNNEFIEIDALGTIPLLSSKFRWYNNLGETISVDPFSTFSSPGTYYLEVKDTITGCVNIDTFDIDFNFDAPILITSNDLELICDANTGNILVNSNIPGSTYDWSTMNGTIQSNNQLSEIQIQGPGLYFITVTNPLNGCTTVDSILVTQVIEELDLFGLEKFDETCLDEEDGMIMWSDILGGEEPYTILVNSILMSEADLVNLSPGNYFIEISDKNGCDFDTTIFINQGNLFTAATNPIINIESGQNGVLLVTTSIPEDEIETITWSPSEFLSCNNCLNPVANPPNDITYNVTITDKNGCTAETSLTIFVRKVISIYVPNVITPDANGQNDIFTLFSPDIEQINNLEIYNRWGELIFKNENFPASLSSEGWDGRFKSKIVNPGVYVYLAEVKLIDGSIQLLNGDITVIR